MISKLFVLDENTCYHITVCKAKNLLKDKYTKRQADKALKSITNTTGSIY